jgi:hypothetical protein
MENLPLAPKTDTSRMPKKKGKSKGAEEVVDVLAVRACLLRGRLCVG